jgi:hypothetical protein
MYNAMMYISQQALQQMDGLPSATHLFQAQLGEILALTGSENYTRAHEHLSDMRRTEVVWNSPDTETGYQHVGFNLLSECRVSKKSDKTVLVQWALPPTLYEALADPQRWASLDLTILAKLETYCAIVLYEVCSRYRDNPSHLTCKNNQDWWVELLTASPMPIDVVTGEKKIREWRKFKHSHVVDAVKQINQVTDISIELIESSPTYKKVKTIQFSVVRKSSLSRIVDQTDDARQYEAVVAYANKNGITNARDIHMLADMYGEEKLVIALDKLSTRMGQLHLAPITSPISWLRTIIQSPPEETTAPIKQEYSQPSATPQTVKVISEVQGRVVKPLVAPLSSAVTQRREDVFTELLALSSTERQPWIDAFAEVLKAKKLMTVILEKRLNGGSWATGLFKAGMIDLYGSTKYGAGWLL